MVGTRGGDRRLSRAAPSAPGRRYARGVRPLPPPFDAIAAGRPAAIALAGPALLGSRLLTKDLAFDRRRARRVPAARPAARPRADHRGAARARARAPAAQGRRRSSTTSGWPRSRTATRRCSTGCWPSTSRSSCRSSTRRRSGGPARSSATSSGGRAGCGSRPADRDRIPQLLRQGPYEDVRLIVVTDNERILGLGDQGAGGMAIPIGKLALYTAASGIHPVLTLPVSLDVGHRQPGAAGRSALPRAIARRGCAGRPTTSWSRRSSPASPRSGPGCVIQWEDFKQANALRILDRYRDRVPSFNDDIQGTAAVVVGGVLAGAADARGTTSPTTRVVLVGRRRGRDRDRAPAPPGDASRTACPRRDAGGRSCWSTRTAWSTTGARTSTPTKRELALPTAAFAAYGFTTEYPSLVETSSGSGRPSWSARPGSAARSTRRVIRAMAARRPTGRSCCRSPTRPSKAEATPADILRWTGGRALVATGSPFEPVEVDGRAHDDRAGQQRVRLPGHRARRDRGRGADRHRPDVPARRADARRARSPTARLATGALYPPVADLRAVTRAIAVAVAREAVDSGLAGIAGGRRRRRPHRRARCGGRPTSRTTPARHARAPARRARRDRRSARRSSGPPAAGRRSRRSSWPSRGPARSACGCSRRASATRTCTSATASGRARRRS